MRLERQRIRDGADAYELGSVLKSTGNEVIATVLPDRRVWPWTVAGWLMLALAVASPARADFLDDVRRTFQHDIPRTFEQDIPRAFGAKPARTHAPSPPSRRVSPPPRQTRPPPPG